MNKAKVIGLTVTVLAVIGGVAVYNWVKKPKKNSEGFFGADGKSSKSFAKASGIRCKRPNGSYYSQPVGATGCVYGNDIRVS
jgi:hypothetical protein